ncbi:MAG: polyhydroxyalkanoate synthesis regulator [Bacillota bacterium]|nr:polyhydroxyalkanoate synthesis regulator [Bacillota bacterium]
MLDLLISLGWGTFSLTREKAENIVEEMLKKGEMRREESKTLVRALVERGDKERAEFRDFIKNEILNLVHKGNLVARNEFADLEKRVKILEEIKQESAQEIS